MKELKQYFEIGFNQGKNHQNKVAQPQPNWNNDQLLDAFYHGFEYGQLIDSSCFQGFTPYFVEWYHNRYK